LLNNRNYSFTGKQHITMQSQDPAMRLQDLQYFGEFGGVNPSIEDSATYTFLNAGKMEEMFEKEMAGCYLYSRHWNPMNRYLSDALAAMEGTEAAQVTASGMAAISATLMQLCGNGDEIVCGRMVYGGTYALLKNFLPRFGITTRFVDINNVDKIQEAITPRTKVIYCETISNPLLEVANIPALAQLAHENGLPLVVDNTFAPMLVSPAQLGADVVVHSLTKYINGTSDTVAGAICSSKAFINSLSDVNSGATMLLGPVMDSMRSASVLKNLRSLHIRMKQHSHNAAYLAQSFADIGVRTIYPGLTSHPQHQLFSRLLNPGYGCGGMVVVDMGTKQAAYRLMEAMQEAKVGYLAVSLGFFRTLFSSPGSSTSSEIPEAERIQMGLTDGLVRISVGLDNDMAAIFQRISRCLEAVMI
jgi:methionine-gamma-lyase